MILRENEDCLEIEHRPGYFLYLALFSILIVAVYISMLGELYWHIGLFGLVALTVLVILAIWDQGIKTRLDARRKVVDVWYNGLIWFRRPGWHVEFAFSDVDRLEIRRIGRVSRWTHDSYEVRARKGKAALPLTNQRLGFRESHEIAGKIADFIGISTRIEAVE